METLELYNKPLGNTIEAIKEAGETWGRLVYIHIYIYEVESMTTFTVPIGSIWHLTPSQPILRGLGQQ